MPAHNHQSPEHHHHHHAPKALDGLFALGAGLNFAFVLAELGFGFALHSLALLADAAHNFSDVVGLLLAWLAAWLARRKPTATRTYGYSRATILAALANAALLLMAAGGIIVEALQRFNQPAPLAGATMMLVAAAGIAVNAGTALLFFRRHTHDLNLKAAFLHMAADALVSLAVVVTGFLILRTGALWLDPAVSLALAAAILWGSWGLARDACNLALDAVPRHIDAAAVEVYLRALPGVTGLHDLHIWPMSTTETALTVHLIRPGGKIDDALLTAIADTLARKHGIRHTTVQVEDETCAGGC
jgi:cobalt-zinc-cadmium efflux system protein